MSFLLINFFLLSILILITFFIYKTIVVISPVDNTITQLKFIKMRHHPAKRKAMRRGDSIPVSRLTSAAEAKDSIHGNPMDNPIPRKTSLRFVLFVEIISPLPHTS